MLMPSPTPKQIGKSSLDVFDVQLIRRVMLSKADPPKTKIY